MEGDPTPDEASLFPATVGDKLRSSREAQGIELSDVAARTRIPQRHLEAIERSNYGSLPSSTYAIGFAKAYARAIDMDEAVIARELRLELDTKFERVAPTPSYKMEDPTRTPSRGLVWIGVIVAILLLAGVGIYYGTSLFRGTAPPPETLENPEETPTPTPTPTVAAAGQVSFVALDKVWLRVTDATGKMLFEKEMEPGERYDVPADANHPKAKTVRPEKIQVMINGSNAPALGPDGKTVEVEVTAQALLARGTPGAVATPAPARATTSVSAPAPRPSPTSTPRSARPTSTPTTVPSASPPAVSNVTAP